MRTLERQSTGPGSPDREESEQELISLLSAVPSFEGVPARNLRSLVRRATLRSHAPHRILFRQGGRCTELHVVLEGTVELRLEVDAGRSKRIQVIQRGMSFGEIGFITLKPRALTAITGDEGARTLVLRREDLAALIVEDPAVGRRVYRHLFESLAARLGSLPGYLQNYVLWGHRPSTEQMHRLTSRRPISFSRVLAAGGLMAGVVYLVLEWTIGTTLANARLGIWLRQYPGSVSLHALAGALAGWIVGMAYEGRRHRMLLARPDHRSCSNCRYGVFSPDSGKLDCVLRIQQIRSMVVHPGMTADGFTDCPSYQDPSMSQVETVQPASAPSRS